MITQQEIELFNDRIAAYAEDAGIVEPGYTAKVYWNKDPEDPFLTKVCIYIGKRKYLKLPSINIRDANQDISGVIYSAKYLIDTYSHEENSADYISRKILSEMSGLSINAPINQHTTKIILGKENENMTKKSAQEIEFEQFEAQKRAEADAEVAEFKAGIDKEIEGKRRELREAQKKADADEKAAEFWYFYDGLIGNGFSEEQAMQILLAVAKK